MKKTAETLGKNHHCHYLYYYSYRLYIYFSCFLDPFSPWTSLPFGRLNTNHVQTVRFRDHNNDDINVKIKCNDDSSFDITIVRGVSNPITIEHVLCNWNETEQQVISEIENHRVRSRVIIEKNSKVVIFDNVSNFLITLIFYIYSYIFIDINY